jgi:hypothetical protein
VRRWRAGIAVLAVGVATAALYFVSKGKWSDALIDSGREWIVPDALARGELLYRDVVYWFGPFTPYFQAAFLRVFGSGFPALVLAGAAAAAAILTVFHAVVRRVAGRAAFLWTVLAIPALVFMPNAGGALLGMGYRIWHAAGFALGAVALAARPAGRRPSLAMFAAGACAGLAGLCRTEWGLAAAAAAMLASIVRERHRAPAWRAAAVAALGAIVTFAAGLGPFLWRAGAGPLLGDGHVLLTGLPPETRHFLIAFSGLPDWRSGLLELAYSAAMWAGLFALTAWLAWPAGASRPRRLGLALPVLVGVLAVTAVLGGAGGAVLFSAAPFVCLVGLVAGVRRGHGSAAAALAASGFLGLVLSYRRLFHIGDSAYVAPPLLFAFVCAAGLLQLASASPRRRAERARLSVGFALAATALVVAAFAGRLWQYAAIDAVPIAGTGGMLSARPEVAHEIEELARLVRERTAEGGGLVAFPEGEIFNLLSGRKNPIRHQLYLPGYLSASNEGAILRELQASPPAAIILWRRPVSEYDRAMFGEDYGKSLREWIESACALEPFRAAGTPIRANARFIVGWRRDGG